MNAKLKKKIQKKGFVVPDEPLVPESLIITTARAKVYAAELEKVRMKYGTLTPEVIVAEAKKKPEGHPLHDYFEWDNTKAAVKHRLNQARTLVRVVQVTYLEDKSPESPKRAIVSVVRDDGKREYTGIIDALSTQRTRMALIARELRTIAGCKERLKGYQEMIPMIPMLTQALEEGSILLGKAEKKSA